MDGFRICESNEEAMAMLRSTTYRREVNEAEVVRFMQSPLICVLFSRHFGTPTFKPVLGRPCVVPGSHTHHLSLLKRLNCDDEEKAWQFENVPQDDPLMQNKILIELEPGDMVIFDSPRKEADTKTQKKHTVVGQQA